MTDDNLFRNFRENVLPTYQALFVSNEYWTPEKDKIRITPVGTINDTGGTWRIQMPIATNNGTMNVIAYARVSMNMKEFPNTMGYYITDFNAYRADK